MPSQPNITIPQQWLTRFEETCEAELEDQARLLRNAYRTLCLLFGGDEIAPLLSPPTLNNPVEVEMIIDSVLSVRLLFDANRNRIHVRGLYPL